jgi:hypothetical protein
VAVVERSDPADGCGSGGSLRSTPATQAMMPSSGELAVTCHFHPHTHQFQAIHANLAFSANTWPRSRID